MSKKELQEQIDSLNRKVDFYVKLVEELVDSGIRQALKEYDFRKQFLALLDYLKLEYKVEDKHSEGFKKK